MGWSGCGVAAVALDVILSEAKDLDARRSFVACSPMTPEPFQSIFDLRARTGIAPADLRLLIKVGALDSIAGAGPGR